MCGIFGKLAFEGHEPYTKDDLRRTGELIRHRGPDDDGFMVDGPISMGMRRLSIIDIRGGQQPMSDESGDITVVFNGEIYNFQELRAKLESKGRRFRTRSDTEILIHLYADKGVTMLDDLRGMFAFALWDRRKQTLFLARDRLGKKPLHYAVTSAGLVFGSEIKAILPDPHISTDIDPAAVDFYFSMNFIPHPHTIFRQIRKLPPAHYLLATANGVGTPVRYWTLRRTPKTLVSTEEAIQGIHSHLEDAVRCRLISDVPLGLLLSGGLDSSVIAAVMARCAGARIKTFSVGFEASMDNDDILHARLIADRFGTEHHPLRISARGTDIVTKLAAHFDEPFGDSSSLPTYLVAREARQYVTVTLNGDGGDEAFAGYPRYGHVYSLARIFSGLPRTIQNAVRAALYRPLKDIQKADLLVLRKLRKWMVPEHRTIFQAEGFTSDDRQLLYRNDFALGLEANRWDPYFAMLDEARAGSTHPAETVLDADVRLFLPSDLLVKMDMSTMATSLEARAPFLDHRLVEYAAKLPWDMKVRGPVQKWILRKAYRHDLPAEILSRPKKGFGLPLQTWIRDDLRPLVSDVLLNRPEGLAQFFHREALNKFVCSIIDAEKGGEKKLWSLLVFELWHRSLRKAGAE